MEALSQDSRVTDLPPAHKLSLRDLRSIKSFALKYFEDPCSSSDRRPKRSAAKTQMSQLQKRLERFALEGGKGEMGIEFKIRDRPNSADVRGFFFLFFQQIF